MNRLTLVPLAAALAVPAAASAAPAGPLSMTTRAMVEQRRAAPDGTTRIVLASPRHVGPGDRVVMVLAYRNTGARPLDNVTLADPLPRSISYLGAQAGSPEPEVSVDGHSFAPLAALSVATPTGTRPARAADVTAVRWQLPAPLAAGAGGELAFRGTIR